MSGPITAVKRQIVERLLCTSPFAMVVGYDESQTNVTRAGVLSLIRQAQQQMRRRVHVVPMSAPKLGAVYGQKVSNFAGGGSGGRGLASPAKLAALDWFQRIGPQHSYEFMWHLEDDAWSADFGLFASHYANSTADLIIRNHSQHPFWAKNGWLVGSKQHLRPEGTFCFSILAAYRASRAFVHALLHTMVREQTTSHHEIYLPYVISQHPRLQWEPLHPDHEAYGSIGDVAAFKPLCALRQAELYHPVKSWCGELEGYNLERMGPCGGCPHPARGVPSWRTCRALCNVRAGCSGWVYNSGLECYLQRSGRQ